jgi:hypothetical protein
MITHWRLLKVANLISRRPLGPTSQFKSTLLHTMVASVDALNAELAQQTELFNKLRVANSDPAALEESRKRLGEIKRELASLKPGGKDAKKKERLLLKTPKVRHSSFIAPLLLKKYRHFISTRPGHA